MLESKIENELVKQAKHMGFTCYKLDKIPGTRDNPDQLLINPQRYAFHVEVKKPDEEPRASQSAKHRELRDRGQWVYVLDDIDLIPTLLESML